MEIKTHQTDNLTIVEIVSPDIIIATIEDGTDLVGNLYYQGFDKVILHEKNITPSFFDLKTRMAGEILQKFSNYKIRLAIVGNFSKYESKSLNDFVFESNKGRVINFVTSIEEVLN
ncbi:alpha/beta hydrolase [Flavobacterium beibuense F44-8]|uniref:Alpha/beta hydrolase n=1 Tax=Flavobacterium beibuense F44-8 TaxID=1406840 RepID=A0A0A2LIX1_9FLAO|nr:DUF4180 domain-containing protein [Flavobacterium beibuense]KGO79874.1 alpha/beta hydrolase [Flavobacterium beibuense F44-8]